MSDSHYLGRELEKDIQRKSKIIQGHDESRSLEQCPALILNADFQPLNYYPLSIWSWQEAVKAIFRESVTVISEYDKFIHSPSCDMKLPSILALKEYHNISQAPAFTRFNVFLRDNWQCQYCGNSFKTHELTFDHVIPRCQGGITSWENIVASCRACNLRKGSRFLDQCRMQLLNEPIQPTIRHLKNNGRKFPPNFLHESWSDYLYWDSELIVN